MQTMPTTASSRYRCACGAPATIAANVTRPDGRRERLLLCSAMCPTVRSPGVDLDIFLEGDDFAPVLAARPCWCPSEKHPTVAQAVPFCPEHGQINNT
jgi:hypothetical protein